MTLLEYLIDYAESETGIIGEDLIKSEVENIPDKKTRALVIEHLEKIKQGSRDFRI